MKIENIIYSLWLGLKWKAKQLGGMFWGLFSKYIFLKIVY